eukprot:ctg_1679.g375
MAVLGAASEGGTLSEAGRQESFSRLVVQSPSHTHTPVVICCDGDGARSETGRVCAHKPVRPASDSQRSCARIHTPSPAHWRVPLVMARPARARAHRTALPEAIVSGAHTGHHREPHTTTVAEIPASSLPPIISTCRGRIGPPGAAAPAGDIAARCAARYAPPPPTTPGDRSTRTPGDALGDRCAPPRRAPRKKSLPQRLALHVPDAYGANPHHPVGGATASPTAIRWRTADRYASPARYPVRCGTEGDRAISPARRHPSSASPSTLRGQRRSPPPPPPTGRARSSDTTWPRPRCAPDARRPAHTPNRTAAGAGHRCHPPAARPIGDDVGG